MRISVCEFLRLTTHRNWFYINPGHWGSDGMAYEARRIADGKYELIRLEGGRRIVKQLEYFEGKPSTQVRKANQKKLKAYRQHHRPN